MESKREYRNAPGEDIRLPREVYYRCLWTVRDHARLEKLASVLDAGSETVSAADLLPGTEADEADDICVFISDAAAEHAAEELKCIHSALQRIPEVYREGIFDNIVSKTPYDDFAHPNTWKRWKLVFLYELAKELRLI